MTLYDAKFNIKPPFYYYFNVSTHTVQLTSKKKKLIQFSCNNLRTNLIINYETV